ncbi:ribosome biogenesis protein SLX9-domain-containing protein [Halteromyces radiatus]|uniref:ribosome biogenesis protein SLX9-domain-containing protein n=1 Tax=Halteromyces radiatus TaxID=101107 RepID=UPI002220B39C|nr:ribosome biogenesis protein SLX9-domain-containing protein [Halteromyces radiatus]KAI8092941.1 ribosome biogenesis protein SLX9-domain-containing protein [Halteromyces radiatus]
MPKVQNKRTLKNTTIGKPQITKKTNINDTTIEASVSNKPIISKAAKKKQRHEEWMEKLDYAYAARKKQKKLENRQGALNKGFNDFELILQTIQKETPETNNTSSTNTTTTPPAPGSHIISSDKIKSKSAKKKAMIQEMARFQKVMQHSAFKQDPLSTIRQHVQNSFK